MTRARLVYGWRRCVTNSWRGYPSRSLHEYIRDALAIHRDELLHQAKNDTPKAGCILLVSVFGPLSRRVYTEAYYRGVTPG